MLFQAVALLQVITAATISPAYLPGFSEGARSSHYLATGQQLYKDFPSARLLTSEIGGLGYGFRGYIHDSGGLVSPEVLSNPGIINSGGKIVTDFIDGTIPDLIVSYDIFIEDEFVKESTQEYTVISYPVFSEEDMNRSIITTPWGESYQRTIWDAENLYVFVSNGLFQGE